MPLSQSQIDDILRRSGHPSAQQTTDSSGSALWKALDYASRPGEAAFAAISEGMKGRSMGQGVVDALTGTRDFGGRSVFEAMGADPTAMSTKASGLVLDFLNPLDPLNYVGLGGLTKVGKAAKLAGGFDEAAGLAGKWSEQAAKGQRGLLNFAGHQVPLPGQGMALDALQSTGNAIAGSNIGLGLQKLFGGKTGAYRAAMQGQLDVAAQMERIKTQGDFYANQVQAELDPLIDTIRQNTSAAERVEITDLLNAADKGETELHTLAQQFVRPGEKGWERRQKAISAIDVFSAKRKEMASKLEGTGIDYYATDKAGFLSRYFQKNPLASPERIEQEVTGPVGSQILLGPQGAPTNNAFTRGLVQNSIQSPSARTLDEQGKLLWAAGGEVNGQKLTGSDWFEAMEKVQPGFKQSFLSKHRLSIKELNRWAQDAGLGKYEDDVATVLSGMRGELAENIKYHTLVDELEKAGVAVPWDEATHGVGFVKVNQGKWSKAPVAIPTPFNDALNRWNDVAYPTIGAAKLGEQLNAVLPQQLQKLGLMSWMKDILIWGGGPAPYISRNFASAVHKNMLEGLGMNNASHYYGGAMGLIGKWFGDKGVTGGLNPLNKLDETGGAIKSGEFWTSKNGVKYSTKRLFQEYMFKNFHGGGSPDAELMEKITRSDEVRNKVFGGFHKYNMRVEMAARLPLMLKVLEDTEDVVLNMGRQLPKQIDEIAAHPPKTGDFFDVAITNAREAVLRTHFDYTDLTNSEKAIRKHLLPFWTWMRNNIPHETVNLIQQPGKYMKYVRAYQSAFEGQGMEQADLPEWAQRAFAVPMDEAPDGKIQWMDFTGFLPFMETLEAGLSGATLAGILEPQAGKSRFQEFSRFLISRGNPFIVKPLEQAAGKSFFTGRNLSPDKPVTFGAATVSETQKHAMDWIRPLAEIDRLNPGGIFGEREGTNQPDQTKRILRLGTGVRFYKAEDDIASMSEKNRKKKAKASERAAREARAEGDMDRARWHEEQAKRYGG